MLKSYSSKMRVVLWCLLAVGTAVSVPTRLIGADTPEKATPLPSAKEVIDRFIKAIGGREAILNQKAHHATGRLEMMGQGISGSIEVFSAPPDKVLVISKIPGIGEVRQGYDGQIGWSIDPMQGPMVLKDKMLEQLRDQADFYSTLHDATNYTSMQTVAEGPFEGMDCYKLKLVKKSGIESEEYFDKKTGLLVGMYAKQDTPLGSVPATSVLSNYQTFDGVKIPTRISQKVLGVQQVMTIENVESGNVPDKVFELPEQIKTLVKQEAGTK